MTTPNRGTAVPERKAVSDERVRADAEKDETIADLSKRYGALVLDASRQLNEKDETIRRLREALQTIADFDPRTDTEEGFNEWGEAVLFTRSQEIAKAALAATASPAPDTKDGGKES